MKKPGTHAIYIQGKKITLRQYEVLKGIYDGKINKTIAAELGIKLSTVKSHITILFIKCNVKNRTELAVKYKPT